MYVYTFLQSVVNQLFWKIALWAYLCFFYLFFDRLDTKYLQEEGTERVAITLQSAPPPLCIYNRCRGEGGAGLLWRWLYTVSDWLLIWTQSTHTQSLLQSGPRLLLCSLLLVLRKYTNTKSIYLQRKLRVCFFGFLSSSGKLFDATKDHHRLTGWRFARLSRSPVIFYWYPTG